MFPSRRGTGGADGEFVSFRRLRDEGESCAFAGDPGCTPTATGDHYVKVLADDRVHLVQCAGSVRVVELLDLCRGQGLWCVGGREGFRRIIAGR